MNILNGIVVANSGLDGSIEVHVPAIMPRMEPDTLRTSKYIPHYEPPNNVSLDTWGIPRQKEVHTLHNTITAKPFFMNTNKHEGTYLVPPVESFVTIIFLNDDLTECYYMYDAASSDTGDKDYVLDLGGLLNSPNEGDPGKKPNIKVLMRTPNDSVLAFDTNANKNSFIVKVNNGHNIEMQDAEECKIRIETKGGRFVEIDDNSGDITINNGSANILMTGGNILLN